MLLSTHRPPAKKAIFISIWTLAGFLIVIGLLLSYWVFVEYRFFPLKKENVYRSAAMPSNVLLNKIRKYNIRTVIDFRDPDDGALNEKKILDPVGVRHINLPSKQVPSNETIQTFLSILDNPENRPLLIHCEHGVGRAGAFSAIYRMEYDKWDNDRAIQEAKWLSTFGSFYKGSGKEIFLSNYTPRWKHSHLKQK